MISWVREKVAERRARWRKQVEDDKSTETQNSLEINTQETDQSFSGDSKNVTEQNSDNKDELNVRVFTSRGKNLIIRIKNTATCYDLKSEAYKKFKEIPNALPSNANNIEILKIIQAKNKRKLDETLTLKDIRVQENDEFILTFKRTATTSYPEELHGPSLSQVMHATKDVQSTRVSPPTVNIDDLVFQNDLQFDIRKILISLAQSSAYIIGGGPYAERLISMLKLRLINRRKHNSDTVECLTEMGFTKERTIYALKLKNGVYAAALDWLIENQSTTNLVVNSSSSITNANSLNISKDNIEALLEIIRIHAHKNTPPSTEMIKTIVEMGFSEEDVIEALRATRNNQAAACEWLVGIRTKSLTELRDGLPQESPVLKALLSSPQVQISLGNPKMFIAYISMLENYSAMSMWLGDNDTSGILGHILRTYHEEKHIVAINQFSSML